MLYDQARANLLIAGSCSEIFRVDLEEGIFCEPMQSNLEAINAMAINPALPLLVCAGDGGIVETWDLREDGTKPMSELNVYVDGDDETVPKACTSIAFSSDGMKMAVGTAAGVVRVYDVRSNKAICERDHYNGLPILSVEFHKPREGENEEMIVSADAKAVKLWHYSNKGKTDLFTSLENDTQIRHFTMWPNSGMVLVANDQDRCGAFFIPALGVAPKWCSFLDSMTEELEEKPTSTVFDNYVFVTTEQLHQLNADHLVGTNMLQPYMHGFFMDHRLHQKLKRASEPFAFEEYKKKRVEEKLAEKRKMRVKEKKVLGTNAELKERLLKATEIADGEQISSKKQKQMDNAKSVLQDDRFAKMFENPDFEIEKVGPASKKRKQ